MTGEMSQADCTRGEYPLHFAAARALGGKVKPFDVYQGPYVQTEHGDLWLCVLVADGAVGYWYNSRTDKRSPYFFLYAETNHAACKCARNIVFDLTDEDRK